MSERGMTRRKARQTACPPGTDGDCAFLEGYGDYDETQLQAAVLLAQGREADVYLLPDGAVLKLLRDVEGVERVRRELVVLTLLGRSRLAVS